MAMRCLSNLKLLEETALCRISFPVFSQGFLSLCSTIFDTVNVSPFRVTLVITLLRWIRSQHHLHAILTNNFRPTVAQSGAKTRTNKISAQTTALSNGKGKQTMVRVPKT